MQGYVIQITPQRNEDIILHVLTPAHILRLYRFYGARHSTIALGKKLDFEIEYNGNFMPKMRNITPINFEFERNLTRLWAWQQYLRSLHLHFRGIENIENFYYEALDLGAQKMQRQNPMRVVIEMYVHLLRHEGRIPNLDDCFICAQRLDSTLSLGRAFLGAHPDCIRHPVTFDKNHLLRLFDSHSTAHMEDSTISGLYHICQLGI